MLSDEWLPRYRLLENFTAKWNGNGNGNGNGNAYDRGDYNSSFALRAVELKRTATKSSRIKCTRCEAIHKENAHSTSILTKSDTNFPYGLFQKKWLEKLKKCQF